MRVKRFFAAAIAVFAMAFHAVADTYTADGWRYKVDGEDIRIVNGTKRLVAAYASLGAGSTSVSALEAGTASGAVAIPSSLPFPAKRKGELVLQGVDPESIPENLPVEALNNYAFRNMSGITSVAFPDTVKSIGNYAFFGCTGIKEIVLGDSVEKIGTSAFFGCTGIEKLDLGKIVKEIGPSAFRGCSALENVEVPHSVEKLGNHAFAECGMERVYVHSPRTDMEPDVFASCPNLASARIPYYFYREGALTVYETYFNGSSNILVLVDDGKWRAKIEYFHLITFDAGLLEGISLQEDWPEPRQCRPSFAPEECHLEINRWTEDGWPEGMAPDRVESLREAIARGGCDCGATHLDLPHPSLNADGSFGGWGESDAGNFAGWYDSPDGDLVDIDLDWRPHDDETYYGRWWCTVRTQAAGVGLADPVVGSNCWVNPAAEKKVVSGTQVALSAAAGDGLVFAGWYFDDEPLVFGDDYRNPKKTVTVKRLDATYVARFALESSVGEPVADETMFDETIMHPESLFFSETFCLEKMRGRECNCATNGIWCCCNPVRRKFIYWKDPSGKYTADEEGFIDTQTSAKLCAVVKVDSVTLPTLSIKAKSLPKGFTIERGTHGENGYVLKGITDAPGCHRLDFTLENSATSVVQSVWLRFPNWTNQVFTVAGLQDVYKLTGKAGEWDFHPVAYPIKSAGWSLSVADLPDGMKYDAVKCTMVGSPKKSGIYTPVFTAKMGSETVKASCTVIVQLPVLTVLKSGDGTISGEDKTGKYEKEFIPGTKVPLTAKAAKNWVFAGWYAANGTPANQAGISGFDVDWRVESVSFPMPETNLFLRARFRSIGSLHPVSICEIPDQTLTTDGTFEGGAFDLGYYIESDAFPKVTVKGLPPGIVFNAKTLLLTGSCKKPGIYPVTVSASASWSKAVAVRKFNIIVPNIRWGLDGIPLDFEDSYLLPGGVPPSLHNEFVALDMDGWKLTLSGLPPGVKFDAKGKTLAGVATKAGYFTVTFTAKRGKETRLCTSTFIVEFPELTVLTAELNPGSGASGKATGGGFYPSGKKVSLKAVPDKGCVFAGWFDEGDAMMSQLASWQFVTEPSNRTFTAKFATLAEDAASIALHACFTGCFDRCNDLYPCIDPCRPSHYYENAEYVADCMPLGESTNITVTSGVYVEWQFAPEAITQVSVAVAGLPRGLSMKQDKATGVYTVSGVPSQASKKDKNGAYIPSKTVFTVTTAGKSKAQYTVNIVVEPLPAWAVGVFEGAVYGCYNCLGDCYEPSAEHRIAGGIATLAVAANGKMTCKFPPVVSSEAEIPSLSAAYFDCYDRENEVLTGRLTGKIRGVTVTYPVSIENDVVDESARGVAQVDYEIGPDGYGFLSLGGMHFGLDGWTGSRNMWKEEPWKTLAAKFAKAKPMKFELPGTDGTTLMEVKFSAGGKATVKYGKASASTVLVPFEDEGSILYSIPVFLYFGYDADPISRGVVIYLEWNGTEFVLVEIEDTAAY